MIVFFLQFAVFDQKCYFCEKFFVMNKSQKTSFCRIISDLIKADSVIDRRELNIFEKIKHDFHISGDNLKDANFISFADAVDNLQSLSREQKEQVISTAQEITIADGMCNKDEALLMLALEYCLERKSRASMIQVLHPGLKMENSQVMYLENDFDANVNSLIKENYHKIENSMRLAGLSFIYIPRITEVYNETPEGLLKDVIKFLSPDYVDEEFDKIVNKLKKMSTSEFCEEELCKKLHIDDANFQKPSLLIKVSKTITADNTYDNFLRIELKKNFVDEIVQLNYRLTSMLNAEYSIVRNIFHTQDRFVYDGIYKEVLDLCLLREAERSTILIDPYHQKIRFPEINSELEVPRAARALYVLLLMESARGGIDFSNPMDWSEDYRKKIREKYKHIYKNFGGNIDEAPDIELSSIRNPRVSNIRSAIFNLEDQLMNTDDYQVHLRHGKCRIYIDPSLINVISQDGNKIPWNQSKEWSRIMEL